jgi:hypothetical protein
MKYYRILHESEADEQDLLENREAHNDCWTLSPKWFFSWFLLGWLIITIICLLIGTLNLA